MTREEAMDQLSQLMAYNYGRNGDEPDYATVWNRIQDLTDYIFCHEPLPTLDSWEMSEGFIKFLEKIRT